VSTGTPAISIPAISIPAISIPAVGTPAEWPGHLVSGGCQRGSKRGTEPAPADNGQARPGVSA
jgi:hypothetical protein